MSMSNIALETPGLSQPKFIAEVVTSPEYVKECFRLRYDIFAGEMGAKIDSSERLDIDRFDAHCAHLAVFDTQTGKIIATTRLLTDADADHTGGFYSETEFDLSSIVSMSGRFMEVGRTCIHPDYRKGGVLAILWQGIAKVVARRKIDYLIGCASLPLSSGDQYINSVMHHIRTRNFSKPEARVRPLVPLRQVETTLVDDVIMPPLLKGYLRQGALICGEPYWDAEFGVADVFVLLDCEHIAARYQKHFMQRKSA